MGKWSNLTVAYFSDGLVQPPTRIAASKEFALNNLTAIPLCSFIEVNPTNEHWKPMVFSDIFLWGFRSFRLSCTSKTWTNVTYQAWCDFQKRPNRKPFTIDEQLTYLLAQNIHFFQLQGNLNNAWHLSTIGTWGAILESILKTRFRTLTFLRPPWAVERLVWAVERAAPWAKEKALGTPRRDKHGERTAEIRWAFKRSSLHATVGVSTGVVASWLCPPWKVGVLRVLTLSTFCFQFICLRMPPLSFGIVSVKSSLFVLLLHF